MASQFVGNMIFLSKTLSLNIDNRMLIPVTLCNGVGRLISEMVLNSVCTLKYTYGKN